jgi:hypothetical protein
VNVQGSLVQRNDQAGTPQYGLLMILFMFAWPAAWFMFLIWVLSPLLFGIPAPGEFLSTWVFFGIATLGNAAELIVALVVLRREGYRLTLRDLRDRARLRLPWGWKAWGLVPVTIAILALGILLAPLNEALATVPGFVPPAWWPPTTNPTVEITATEDAYPDITLAGNYLFLAVVLIYGIFFNTLGESCTIAACSYPRCGVSLASGTGWLTASSSHSNTSTNAGRGVLEYLVVLPSPCWAAPSAACRWRCCCIGQAIGSWA